MAQKMDKKIVKQTHRFIGLENGSVSPENVGHISGTAASLEDVFIMDQPEERFVWQQLLMDKFFIESEKTFLEADNRQVTWVFDQQGMSGKSIFVKWFCVNFPEECCKLTFGTPT